MGKIIALLLRVLRPPLCGLRRFSPPLLGSPKADQASVASFTPSLPLETLMPKLVQFSSLPAALRPSRIHTRSPSARPYSQGPNLLPPLFPPPGFPFLEVMLYIICRGGRWKKFRLLWGAVLVFVFKVSQAYRHNRWSSAFRRRFAGVSVRRVVRFVWQYRCRRV